MDDVGDYMIGILALALLIALLAGAICGSICAYQEYHDRQVCLQKTGLYSGCELKEHEDTHHIIIKKDN